VSVPSMQAIAAMVSFFVIALSLSPRPRNQNAQRA
jgi:hypothetical protein